MEGRLLNQYELVTPLGRGGMGVVYRARDRELGREVAIKLLPPELATDPDRLVRLEREARTLASVSHPGIATLFGLGQAEIDGRPVRFLAMELVEGEDLATRLARVGALGVEEASALGRQIAAALEVAHEAGVVHRDLKPANVRVTPLDRAVVVDFGLAKPLGVDSGGSAGQPLSESPTADSPTLAGAILGTAPYMSPEQARGKPVDRRADIWAFGCVLFEMLTGTRAFRGESVSDTLAALLKEDPDWSRLPKETPGTVLGLLRRCLDRDSQTRLRDIGEARIALSLEAGADESKGSATSERAGSRAIPWRWLLPSGLALALIALALGAVIGDRLNGRRKATEPSYRLVLAAPAETRLLEGQPPAVSPDGRTIAFAVRQGPRTGIYLRRLDSFEPTPVTGAERGERPFFSPDGQWLGFIVEGRLLKVPIGGGKPTLILEAGWAVTAHWHSDDEIVLGGNDDLLRSGLFRVAADGSGSSRLTTIDRKRKEQLHGWPQVLEDGSILVGVQTEERRRVARYFPKGERLEYLPIDAEPPVFYLPGGRLVYQARSSVWVAPYDLGRGVVGDPVELLSGVGNDEWAVSPSGVLAYLFAGSRGGRVVAVDRQGRVEVVVEEEREYNWPRIAPDGRRFAVGHDAPEGADLWIYELGSGRRLQLQAPGGNGEPTWTPDGRRVAYSTTHTEGGHLHWQLADGSGVSELLHAGSFAEWPTSFSPDGRSVAFYGADGEDPEESIWIASLPTDGSGKASARRAIGGPGTQRAGAFSPDGRFFAYSSSESGESEIYLRPYPDLDSRRFVVSQQGGVDPHWSSDSRELFYRNGDAMYVVAVTPGSEPLVGAPRELFRGHFHFQPNGDQSFDVFPDNQRFLMIQPVPESRRELRVMTGVGRRSRLP